MRFDRLVWIACFALACAMQAGFAQSPVAPRIHIIYMGGDDCPPCVAWRSNELPKLRRTEAFKAIRFSFVLKVIKSGVPSSFFLPEEVKPYKAMFDEAMFDEASGGRTGSPHFAIMVNDEVYDYTFGVRGAADVERMIIAIRDQTPYPYERCVRIAGMGKCAVKG